MVRGRGNRAFGISHSDLEVGTRLLKKIVGKILTAKGIRAFVDGISEVSCDTADRFDLLRHVDGCRIAQSRGHIAGEAESGADPPADGVDGVKDFVDQVIV